MSSIAPIVEAQVPESMQAWVTSRVPGDLTLMTVPVPVPGTGEVLIRVEACGVCRTDLHIIDQELPTHVRGIIPGHQVVGKVAGIGPQTTHLRIGDRVGVAWLGGTCGSCPWCRDGKENLCPESRYTGWDINGGFAEYLTASEAFTYPLPVETIPAATAPLLCAGLIGYRSLMRANLPPGGRLGVYGFGSSAHLTARLAAAQGAQIFAITRGERNQALARQSGAVFVGDEHAVPPQPVDSAIVFAPAGELVPLALQATRPGGTVVLAGIHMSDIPAMNYAQTLFRERDLRSVTANTRSDGMAFLRLAHALRLSPVVIKYPFAQAHGAIDDLRSGRAAGSLVIET